MEGQPCQSLEGMSELLDAAKSADVVILFLGLDIKMTNKEGQDRSHDWTGYRLPGQQEELARQISLLKVTLILTLNPKPSP